MVLNMLQRGMVPLKWDITILGRKDDKAKHMDDTINKLWREVNYVLWAEKFGLADACCPAIELSYEVKHIHGNNEKQSSSMK